MRRLLIVAAAAAILTLAGVVGLVRPPEQPPDVAPVSTGDLVVDAASASDVSGYVTAMQARLRAVPDDAVGWAGLALAYVEQARVTGNAAYYDQAERAVARSLRVQPTDNAVALTARAALAAARHEFSGALRAADRALRIDPYNATALSVRVDALTELGRYEDQLTALRVADRRQPGVPVAARYSYAYELRGRLARASSILARAAEAASPTDRAYLLTLLADLDRRRGLLGRSEEHAREGLRLSPAHVPARAALARVAVAEGRDDVAVRRWQQVTEALPLPEYLTELGELHEQHGRDAEAQQQYAVVEATTRLLAAGGVNVDAEVALFDADHGDAAAALRSARAEWRRHPSIHVADAYAWALHRTGEDRRALVLARKATRLGTDEALLWLHRGTIEAALDREAAAREHLRRGLATDPGVSPLAAANARALLADLRADRRADLRERG